MTYTYTYREGSGAVRSATVEADNRAALFSELKGRGIVPLSVKEGGKVPSERVQSARKAPPRILLWGCVAGIVLIAVLSCIVWTGRDSASQKADTKSSRTGQTSKQKSARERVQQAEAAGTKTASAVKVEKTAPTKAAETNALVQLPGVPELPTTGTNTPPTSAPLPPPTFETASDQVIAMALQADEHGMAPMPLSRDLEKEFLESLKKEIVILDSDDEQTKTLKEQVMATRAEIKKMLDEGQSFNQIMQEHQKLANENAKIRDDATMELKKILDSGDVEGAKAYKRKINLVLEQMGIKGLSIAVTDEEREERAASRRERMLERRARQAAAVEAAAALKQAQEGN